MEKYNKMGNDFTWQMKKEGTEIVCFANQNIILHMWGTTINQFLKFILLHMQGLS